MRDLLEALKTLDSYGLLKERNSKTYLRQAAVSTAFTKDFTKEDVLTLSYGGKKKEKKKRDKRLISQSKADRIKKLFKDGHSQREIGRRLHISTGTVGRYLS